MLALLLASAGLIAYGVAGLQVWRDAGGHRGSALLGLVLHALLLLHQLVEGGSLRIGVNEAASLFTWQSALLLWLFCLRERVALLGAVIYPLAGVMALWATALPSPVSNVRLSDWQVSSHVLCSLLAAGLLTLAAVHALALAAQDRLLHRRDPSWGGLMSRLPPLQTMERLLFELIAVGFLLLSLTLLSGLWFVHDWLAQHLIHKTVLSISAWLIFGALLWGRWRYGWRGRAAIRWTLSGYGVLVLAYFGSKLVLEQILGRHWA
ncbi:MAG TPA: cytochrome c biogenesis protein CcsA [Nevskiaceae bacterium]|nr:cytochrome c biogenesis protein CcsA [Nevskiaceae bacterium]